jgi:hypothetical protein
MGEWSPHLPYQGLIGFAIPIGRSVCNTMVATSKSIWTGSLNHKPRIKRFPAIHLLHAPARPRRIVHLLGMGWRMGRVIIRRHTQCCQAFTQDTSWCLHYRVRSTSHPHLRHLSMDSRLPSWGTKVPLAHIFHLHPSPLSQPLHQMVASSTLQLIKAMRGRLRPRPPPMEYLPHLPCNTLLLPEPPHPEELALILGRSPFPAHCPLWRSARDPYPLWACRQSLPPCPRLHLCHPSLLHLCIHMRLCLPVLDPSPRLEVLHITAM